MICERGGGLWGSLLICKGQLGLWTSQPLRVTNGTIIVSHTAIQCLSVSPTFRDEKEDACNVWGVWASEKDRSMATTQPNVSAQYVSNKHASLRRTVIMENMKQKNSMCKSVHWEFSLFFTGLGHMLDQRLLEKDDS